MLHVSEVYHALVITPPDRNPGFNPGQMLGLAEIPHRFPSPFKVCKMRCYPRILSVIILVQSTYRVRTVQAADTGCNCPRIPDCLRFAMFRQNTLGTLPEYLMPIMPSIIVTCLVHFPWWRQSLHCSRSVPEFPKHNVSAFREK